MSQPISLFPLQCLRCQTPIPARGDEVAWLCPTCAQGLLLDDAKGVLPLDFHFSSAIAPGAVGRPFWIVEGRAALQRSTFQGDSSREMQAFWSNPRQFFVPAFELELEELVRMGALLVRQPLALQAGEQAKFRPVTVLPADIQALAEFILLSIEADRSDALRELKFELQLGAPELWILP